MTLLLNASFKAVLYPDEVLNTTTLIICQKEC